MDNPLSPAAKAILAKMKPLGKWLYEHDHLNRTFGRSHFVTVYGYEALAQVDKDMVEKGTKYRRLANKYRKLRAAEEGGENERISR